MRIALLFCTNIYDGESHSQRNPLSHIRIESVIKIVSSFSTRKLHMCRDVRKTLLWAQEYLIRYVFLPQLSATTLTDDKNASLTTYQICID